MTFPVKLTKKAVNMVINAIKQSDAEDGDMLRVSVYGGGCSGLKYNLNFTDKLGPYDIFSQNNDLKIVLDQFSALHLNGTEIDYEENLSESGFKFNNPNAQMTCGCGSSFS